MATNGKGFNGFSLDDVALRAPTVPLTAGGTTYDLAADVPADVLLDYFLLEKYPLGDRLNAAQAALEAPTREEERAALHRVIEEFNEEIRAILRRVFQNSGYALSDAQLDDLFTPKAQEKIVRGFFTHLMRPSSAPPSASEPPSATTPTPTTSPTQTMTTTGTTKSRRSARA